MEIKEYELIKGCFSESVRINGIDAEQIEQEQLINIITEQLKNHTSFLFETLKEALEYIPAEDIEDDSSRCGQCGDWNYYTKRRVIE
jgi:hypothetical protein